MSPSKPSWISSTGPDNNVRSEPARARLQLRAFQKRPDPDNKQLHLNHEEEELCVSRST